MMINIIIMVGVDIDILQSAANVLNEEKLEIKY